MEDDQSKSLLMSNLPNDVMHFMIVFLSSATWKFCPNYEMIDSFDSFYWLYCYVGSSIHQFIIHSTLDFIESESVQYIITVKAL